MAVSHWDEHEMYVSVLLWLSLCSLIPGYVVVLSAWARDIFGTMAIQQDATISTILCTHCSYFVSEVKFVPIYYVRALNMIFVLYYFSDLFQFSTYSMLTTNICLCVAMLLCVCVCSCFPTESRWTFQCQRYIIQPSIALISQPPSPVPFLQPICRRTLRASSGTWPSIRSNSRCATLPTSSRSRSARSMRIWRPRPMPTTIWRATCRIWRRSKRKHTQCISDRWRCDCRLTPFVCLDHSGSLLIRNLADLVKKEHFILDSEYLTTLLVIVPKWVFDERTVLLWLLWHMSWTLCEYFAGHKLRIGWPITRKSPTWLCRARRRSSRKTPNLRSSMWRCSKRFAISKRGGLSKVMVNATCVIRHPTGCGGVQAACPRKEVCRSRLYVQRRGAGRRQERDHQAGDRQKEAIRELILLCAEMCLRLLNSIFRVLMCNRVLWCDGWKSTSARRSAHGFMSRRCAFSSSRCCGEFVLLCTYSGHDFRNTSFSHSILCRYGLPVNFQAILLQPNKKSTKRLRDVLNQLYSHLDGSAAAPSASSDVSWWTWTLSSDEYSHIVCMHCLAERRHSRPGLRSVRILSVRVLQAEHRHGRIESVSMRRIVHEPPTGRPPPKSRVD